MTVLYFTKTGTSKRIAERLCDVMGGGTIQSFEEAAGLANGEVSDDMVAVICPVHAFQVPGAAKKLLARLTIKAEYTAVLMPCGGLALGAVKSLAKQVEARGAKVSFSKALFQQKGMKEEREAGEKHALEAIKNRVAN